MKLINGLLLVFGFPAFLFFCFLYYFADHDTKVYLVGSIGPIALVFPLAIVLFLVRAAKKVY